MPQALQATVQWYSVREKQAKWDFTGHTSPALAECCNIAAKQTTYRRREVVGRTDQRRCGTCRLMVSSLFWNRAMRCMSIFLLHGMVVVKHSVFTVTN